MLKSLAQINYAGSIAFNCNIQALHLALHDDYMEMYMQTVAISISPIHACNKYENYNFLSAFNLILKPDEADNKIQSPQT